MAMMTPAASRFLTPTKAAEQSNAAIYAIGVFSTDDRKNDKKMVRRSTKELKKSLLKLPAVWLISLKLWMK